MHQCHAALKYHTSDPAIHVAVISQETTARHIPQETYAYNQVKADQSIHRLPRTPP